MLIWFICGDLLIEVAPLTIFYHLYVLVVEFSSIELLNLNPLSFIFVLERVLELIIKPFQDPGVVLSEGLDLVHSVLTVLISCALC